MGASKNKATSDELSFAARLRMNFIYGLILVMPVVATVWLVIFSINVFSGPFDALFHKELPPVVSFFLTIIIITFIGFAGRNIIGDAIIRFLESLMSRIPIIRVIYKSMKQIVTAFSFNNTNLLSAVLVQYPRDGSWALAFVTNRTAGGLRKKDGSKFGKDMVSLFVPTTPNPTSGYFIYVERSELVEIDLTVEESIKVLMSAGVLTPDSDEVKK